MPERGRRRTAPPPHRPQRRRRPAGPAARRRGPWARPTRRRSCGRSPRPSSSARRQRRRRRPWSCLSVPQGDGAVLERLADLARRTVRDTDVTLARRPERAGAAAGRRRRPGVRAGAGAAAAAAARPRDGRRADGPRRARAGHRRRGAAGPRARRRAPDRGGAPRGEGPMRVAVVGATGMIGGRSRGAAGPRRRVVAVSRGGGPRHRRRRGRPLGPGRGPAAGGRPGRRRRGREPRRRADRAAGAGRPPASARSTRAGCCTTRLLVDALACEGAAARARQRAAPWATTARARRRSTRARPPASDFLADTCVAWEREAVPRRGGRRAGRARAHRHRPRRPTGGALPQMARPVRLFAGGPIGGGRQWLPWIHIDDEVGLILLALDRDDVSGPLNAAAPEPVRQREFVAGARARPRPADGPADARGRPAARAGRDGDARPRRPARRAARRRSRPATASASPEPEPALRDLLG